MRKYYAMLVLGVAAICTTIYVSNRADAQGKAGSPQTRVALLNLNYVIKNYTKYKHFQASVKAEGQSHQKTIQTKSAQMESIKKKVVSVTDPAEREKMEQQLRQLKREIEDITVSARSKLARKGSEAMVTIYKEVREAAQRHAIAHGFDLVLHFEEAATEAELDTPKNIMRKMNAGGCVPMYWKNGMDISWHVMRALNAKTQSGR